MDQHLHLNSSCRKGSALTFNLILSERLCTYIRPCSKTSHRKGTQSQTKDSWKLTRCLHSPREWNQSLYLIKWEHIPQSHQNGHALTSDHVILHPTVISEWPSVPDWVFLVIDQLPPFQEWNSTLISDHVGTNPTVTSEWFSAHIWHGRNQSLSPW